MHTFHVVLRLFPMTLHPSPCAGRMQSPAEELAALGSGRTTGQMEPEEGRSFTKPSTELLWEQGDGCILTNTMPYT